jgi:hypothetical protein
MLRKAVFIFALAVAAAPLPARADEPLSDLKLQAADLVKEYATTLQAALKGELEKSGPVAAISFCHDQAPQIAADIARRSGWTVGRTSLKLRNAASAPDAFETLAMKEFDARMAKGEAASDLVKAMVVADGGGKTFRFVKAIPTGEVCLTCHGTGVKPEIKAKLDELYPGDKATGFKVGDMRGIFTLGKKL